MKQDGFWEEALGELSDRHIEEALSGAPAEEKGRAKTPRKKGLRWPVIAAAAAAVVLIAGGYFAFSGGRLSALRAYAVNEAVYPETPLYREEWSAIGRDAAAGMRSFTAAAMAEFLRAESGENRLFAPLNVYMALAMTAEMTAGESRMQLLELLGADSLDMLRLLASQQWNAGYRNDGQSVSIPAASLWMDDSLEFAPAVPQILADTYYASTYRGDLQSEKMNRMLKTWLKEQTGGLLDTQIDGIEISPEAVFELITTVYFREKWRTEFLARNTETGTFYGAGGETEVPFMYQTMTENYYWGEKFGAAGKLLDGGSRMWFILPDEGVTVNDLLEDAEAMSFLTSPGADWENAKRVIIRFYLPKFDLSAASDLTGGLQNLGVRDVFRPETADFTPLTAAEGVYFSKIEHAVRVAVDEEGVTAAAYTRAEYTGAAEPPDEEIEFRLDRPFLFVIVNRGGLPLFAGAVNQP